MSDEEARDDELVALESIYDTELFQATRDGDLFGGRFLAKQELTDNFAVLINKGRNDDSAATPKKYSIKFLPAIELNFMLPDTYPSQHPPNFTLSCKWLTLEQISTLCSKLDDLWSSNKGDVIIFIWTSFLQDEALEFLKLRSPLNLSQVVRARRPPRSRRNAKKNRQSSSATQIDPNLVTSEFRRDTIKNVNVERTGIVAESSSRTPGSTSNVERNILPAGRSNLKRRFIDPRAVQDIACQDLLLQTILEHNDIELQRQFDTGTYQCEVCFSEHLGSSCIRYPSCNHVYCKDCMKSYYQVKIVDGEVTNLTCPASNCDTQPHPDQVKNLVGEELFDRYDRLLLQQSLDTMNDVVYCPRKSCGCACLVDEETNMANCSACSFSFCVFCKQCYHGVSPCKIKAYEMIKIREEYENGNAATKAALERRYGKRSITLIVEESYSQDWMEENSKKCPSCKASIQKIDGCNKMSCSKCQCYFCWLCMTKLGRANPYTHFNQPGSPCYNQLFQGVVLNDGDEVLDDDEFIMIDDDDDDDEDDGIWFVM